MANQVLSLSDARKKRAVQLKINPRVNLKRAPKTNISNDEKLKILKAEVPGMTLEIALKTVKKLDEIRAKELKRGKEENREFRQWFKKLPPMEDDKAPKATPKPKGDPKQLKIQFDLA